MTWDIAPSQDEVTQPFGETTYSNEWAAPWLATGHLHAGVDLGYSGGGNATCGRPVYATRDGVVVAVGSNGTSDSGFATYLGSNAVCVHYLHDGVYVLLGHLSAASVTVGQVVHAGDKLGAIGSLGYSTACHLHVEVRTDGPFQNVNNQGAALRDPTPYLNRLPAPAPIPQQQEEAMLIEIQPGEHKRFPASPTTAYALTAQDQDVQGDIRCHDQKGTTQYFAGPLNLVGAAKTGKGPQTTGGTLGQLGMKEPGSFTVELAANSGPVVLSLR